MPVPLAALACCLGCTSPEPRDDAPFADPPGFSVVDPPGATAAADHWWTTFDDTELDRRIDRALRDNFTLAAAWERLQAANALARRTGADQAVQLDATAGAGVRDGSNVDQRTEVSVGLEASYEIDLWGRLEAATEAERLRARATADDYRTAAITVSAEVASAWYELAEARQQRDLVGSQLTTNQDVLAVLEKRFAVGQSGGADVLRQRQLVEATREQLVVADERIALIEHRLAVLEGQPPQRGEAVPRVVLPGVAARPATGLASDLVRRRPDIRAAMRRLEAADQEVAAAVSDQYPRLDLTAGIGTSGERPAALFDDWLASLAAQLVAPLLDGGRRQAEIDRTAAEQRQRLAEYGDVVLTAFREVEDALASEAARARRLQSLELQLELARTTYGQLRTQYLNGAADYIDVLTSLREQQQLERDVLSARLGRITGRIALHRALAGGFDTPREVADANERDRMEAEDDRG